MESLIFNMVTALNSEWIQSDNPASVSLPIHWVWRYSQVELKIPAQQKMLDFNSRDRTEQSTELAFDNWFSASKPDTPASSQQKGS